MPISRSCPRSGRCSRPTRVAPRAMTVTLDPGMLLGSGSIVSQGTQVSGTITAPVSNPRIDLVTISSSTGALSIVDGTEAASPAAPACPAGSAPIAQIALSVGQASIINSNITDVRTFYAGSAQSQSVPVRQTVQQNGFRRDRSRQRVTAESCRAFNAHLLPSPQASAHPAPSFC